MTAPTSSATMGLIGSAAPVARMPAPPKYSSNATLPMMAPRHTAASTRGGPTTVTVRINRTKGSNSMATSPVQKQEGEGQQPEGHPPLKKEGGGGAPAPPQRSLPGSRAPPPPQTGTRGTTPRRGPKASRLAAPMDAASTRHAETNPATLPRAAA